MAVERVTKAVVDAGVLIAYLNREAGRFEKSKDLLEEAEEGRLELWAPMVIQVEVCRWSKDVPKDDAEAREELEAFVESPWLHVVEVDRTLSRIARDVVATTSVKTGVDALYVATADRMGIDVVYAWDERVIDTVYKGVRGLEPPGAVSPKLDFGVTGPGELDVPAPEGEADDASVGALGEGAPDDEAPSDDGVAEEDV